MSPPQPHLSPLDWGRVGTPLALPLPVLMVAGSTASLLSGPADCAGMDGATTLKPVQPPACLGLTPLVLGWERCEWCPQNGVAGVMGQGLSSLEWCSQGKHDLGWAPCFSPQSVTAFIAASEVRGEMRGRGGQAVVGTVVLDEDSPAGDGSGGQ